MPFGNVNVSYKPCCSVAQLKYAANYMLGRNRDQIKNGIVKTTSDLYMALGCNRDNFANNVLVTRKVHGLKSRKDKDILAHKISISFHPDDEVAYAVAYQIARDFAEMYAHSKGYEVLFAVHTDTKHVHAHFLIGNCNMENGKSYRRNQRDLYEMSEYFGEQCVKHGFVNSVREDFYNKNPEKVRDKQTFAEEQMKKRGAESFKDELRESIRIEIADQRNRTFDDVIRALKNHYNVECRVAGNTVSYRHPKYLDKNGKPVSVRGSRLGEMYTRKGIENELTKKRGKRADSRTADLAAAVDDLTRFVGADADNAAEQRTGGRGQISSVATTRNGKQTSHGAGNFYEQGGKQAESDRQQPARTISLQEEYQNGIRDDARKLLNTLYHNIREEQDKILNENLQKNTEAYEQMIASAKICKEETDKAVSHILATSKSMFRLVSIGDLIYYIAPIAVIVDAVLCVIEHFL